MNVYGFVGNKTLYKVDFLGLECVGGVWYFTGTTKVINGNRYQLFQKDFVCSNGGSGTIGQWRTVSSEPRPPKENNPANGTNKNSDAKESNRNTDKSPIDSVTVNSRIKDAIMDLNAATSGLGGAKIKAVKGLIQIAGTLVDGKQSWEEKDEILTYFEALAKNPNHLDCIFFCQSFYKALPSNAATGIGCKGCEQMCLCAFKK